MADLAPWLTLLARIVASVVLGAVALLHAFWAFGLWWPARSEAHLVHAVVGARRAERMPGAIPCLVVAVGLAVAAALPWAPADGFLGRWSPPVLQFLAAIFALRGLAPLLPIWRRATAREPFATLDRRLYAPLSLGLAVCLWVIARG